MHERGDEMNRTRRPGARKVDREMTIRHILSQYKQYKSDAKFYSTLLQSNYNVACQDQLQQLEVKIASVDCWLGLLSEDEAFIVRRHFFDEVEWSRIVTEFRDKWSTHGKSERTLQKYQARAIQRIRTFFQAHECALASIFEDELLMIEVDRAGK